MLLKMPLFKYTSIKCNFLSACECSMTGSLTPVCNQTTGQCFCKANTQGLKCDQCKPGTFSLASSNPDGCQSCYGFGHSISCTAASRFTSDTISSNFTCKYFLMYLPPELSIRFILSFAWYAYCRGTTLQS